jgi:hypothetical protein
LSEASTIGHGHQRVYPPAYRSDCRNRSRPGLAQIGADVEQRSTHFEHLTEKIKAKSAALVARFDCGLIREQTRRG